MLCEQTGTTVSNYGETLSYQCGWVWTHTAESSQRTSFFTYFNSQTLESVPVHKFTVKSLHLQWMHQWSMLT